MTSRFLALPFLITSIGILGFLGIPPKAQGATECVFKEKLVALQAIVSKNTEQDTLEGIKEEVSLRRALIQDVIRCTRNDAETLRSKLEKISFPSKMSATREYLMVALNQNLAHYDALQNSLSDLGIKGLKDTARDLASWRRETESGLLITINNFLIWTANEELLGKADARLAQIRGTVHSLTALIENEEARTALSHAEESFANAETAHIHARETFEKYPFPADPLPFIKTTLESLVTTYQQFFTLADIVNTLVPRR